MDFSVSLAGLELEHPIMNAAGTCKMLEGPEGVKEVARSPVSAVMVGSITVSSRLGNPGETYFSGKGFSLNCVGLQNPGKDYYARELSEMARIVHGEGKPLFVSVAGFSPIEYVVLSELCFQAGADLVELNLSCPNVWQANGHVTLLCFDWELTAEILYKLERELGAEARISVKFSPFPDPSALDSMAELFNTLGLVKAVTTANTFPNAFAFDGRGRPRVGDGFMLAGLGGPALKPIALGQVMQFKELLRPDIKIIGVGGIQSARDVLDYLRVGASAVQIGTHLLDKGTRVFSQLLTELLEIVDVDID